MHNATTSQVNTNLEKQVEKLAPFIGHTPLYPLDNLLPNPRVRLLAKLEWQQLGGSVKARPAFQIIKEAIQEGHLHPEKSILDASTSRPLAQIWFTLLPWVPQMRHKIKQLN